MKYPAEKFEDEVAGKLKELLVKIDREFAENIKLEIPPSPDKGDLSFACFPLAKILKKPPQEISVEIARAVGKGEWIDRVEACGGYVNFFINVEKLCAETVRLIREMDEKYGSFESRKEKVIIEHTSANPNGPLHVGRARNPIIGDTLVRVYRFYGYSVKSQFYVDDLGKQVAILAWGLKNIDPSTLPPPSREKADHYLVRFYQKAYQMMEENPDVEEEINEITRLCESGDEKTIEMVREAYEKALDGIKESLKRINVEFDEFVEESRFVRDGSVYKVVEELKKSKYAGSEDGAWYIDLREFGIQGRDTRFFFTRKDGTTLYATRDIAYHIWKLNQADIIINVLGEDHKLEAKQVEIALRILGMKRLPKVVFYSFVTLPEGKLSTRRGRVIYLDDLIDEAIERAYREVKKRRGNELDEERLREIAEIVGIGALRYNIVKIQPEKDIVFKWEEALNFEGDSAPFVQYAHARACSILRKESAPEKITVRNLKHPSEISLAKVLSRFPNVVKISCTQNRPHLIPSYLFELASTFNQFYRDCPVLKAESEEIKKERLALVDSVRIVLRNGLSLLGIEAPEEM
ncbi:MAG: arginine--tRNA ligase [Thermoplasmata archaeon]|nr:MAG: arginine--tRNA ligase [Thermoplasmata archaeon]